MRRLLDAVGFRAGALVSAVALSGCFLFPPGDMDGGTDGGAVTIAFRVVQEDPQVGVAGARVVLESTTTYAQDSDSMGNVRFTVTPEESVGLFTLTVAKRGSQALTVVGIPAPTGDFRIDPLFESTVAKADLRGRVDNKQGMMNRVLVGGVGVDNASTTDVQYETKYLATSTAPLVVLGLEVDSSGNLVATDQTEPFNRTGGAIQNAHLSLRPIPGNMLDTRRVTVDFGAPDAGLLNPNMTLAEAVAQRDVTDTSSLTVGVGRLDTAQGFAVGVRLSIPQLSMFQASQATIRLSRTNPAITFATQFPLADMVTVSAPLVLDFTQRGTNLGDLSVSGTGRGPEALLIDLTDVTGGRVSPNWRVILLRANLDRWRIQQWPELPSGILLADIGLGTGKRTRVQAKMVKRADSAGPQVWARPIRNDLLPDQQYLVFGPELEIEGVR